MLEIPDIYFGVKVDAGPEPRYEEKMRVPPPPWDSNTFFLLLCIFLSLSFNFGKVPMWGHSSCNASLSQPNVQK